MSSWCTTHYICFVCFLYLRHTLTLPCLFFLLATHSRGVSETTRNQSPALLLQTVALRLHKLPDPLGEVLAQGLHIELGIRRPIGGLPPSRPPRSHLSPASIWCDRRPRPTRDFTILLVESEEASASIDPTQHYNFNPIWFPSRDRRATARGLGEGQHMQHTCSKLANEVPTTKSNARPYHHTQPYGALHRTLCAG